MKARIYYKGEMTDKYPAQVWVVISDYVLDPFYYKKVVNYLKEKYGRCKPKIMWASVNKLSEDEKFMWNKLKEWNLKDSCPLHILYGFYYFDLLTQFEISGHSYSIRQEGLMKVSKVISQVLVRRMSMYDKNGVVVVEVK